MESPLRYRLLVVGLAGLVLVAAIACIVVAVMNGGETLPETTTPVQPTPGHATKPDLSTYPRRLPIAGAEGYTVVVNQDGSSYLEDPSGRRTHLLDGNQKPNATDILAERLAKRLSQTGPRRLGQGQLLVLDTGIVEVPGDGIVTFTGSNHAVVLMPDGASASYYVDGRVEHREKVVRRPIDGASEGTRP